jgi:small subunit ribosomal protein S7
MSRGTPKYKKTIILPDAKFNSTTIAKFINRIMESGKKTVAQTIVYDALEIASKEVSRDELDVFSAALNNVAPSVEVRGRRIGGANYQIPVEVREPRRTALAMRWIIAAAKERKGEEMSKKLSRELVDALNSTGAAVKKKIDTHKMAEANKAFAHFAKVR